MIWKIPRKVVVISGKGYGNTLLNAFDKALLDAGIGNLNLIQVSSVVPADAEVFELRKVVPLEILPGTFIPAVYTYITSDTIGENIAAAVAVGKPYNKETNGMIFESALVGDLVTACDVAKAMVKEAFEMRDLEVDNLIVVGSELTINDKIGCVIAAALMLP